MSAGAQAYLVKPVDLDEVARTIAWLNRESELKSIEARNEEARVIREELSLQRQQLGARRVEATEKKTQALERLLRMKARLAFIGAGGTRANFERMWPDLCANTKTRSA
jgi:DNA-binding response OmpR family regulator